MTGGPGVSILVPRARGVRTVISGVWLQRVSCNSMCRNLKTMGQQHWRSCTPLAPRMTSTDTPNSAATLIVGQATEPVCLPALCPA